MYSLKVKISKLLYPQQQPQNKVKSEQRMLGRKQRPQDASLLSLPGYSDPYLPGDIVFKILLGLPAKDLVILKRVCKLWFSVISDPKFVNAHLARVQPSIIFSTKYEGSPHCYCIENEAIRCNVLHEKHNTMTRAEEISLDFIGKSVKLINTCRGLLLVRKVVNSRELYICNPVTRRCKTVPLFTRYLWEHNWALVHDPSIEKYKVFGISRAKEKGRVSTRIMVVTIGRGNNQWRELVPVITPNKFRVYEKAFFAVTGRELHWLAASENFGDKPRFAIYSIDITKEEFTYIIVPPYIPNRCYLLTEVRGILCLVTNMYFLRDTFEVWALEDRVNCQWTKMYNIRISSKSFLKGGGCASGNVWSCIAPCFFATRNSSDNFLGLLKILIFHEQMIYLYDLKNQELREVALRNKNGKLEILLQSHFNSLVSWK